MTSARDDILRRVRTANANASVNARRGSHEPTGQRSGRTGAEADVRALFVERTEDYRAVVETCCDNEVADRVAACLADADSIVVPQGFPERWGCALPAGVAQRDPGTTAELDAVAAVVTSAAAAIAETGTIVLDHTAGQGRRALSLVPDRHVCVVTASQIYEDVPTAVQALADAVRAGRPLTWISGPSATSDIELSRVEGVHGPRQLHVIVVKDR